MPRKKREDQEKPKRRVRGEGTVIQRDDGRFVARVPLGDGKRKEEYYDTRLEAERARRRMLNERDAGKLTTQRDQSLEEYLKYWLNAHCVTTRKTTHSMYHYYLTKYVVPDLGHVGLRKLTVEMFQSLYQKWGQGQLSPNTIRLIHKIMRKALEDAVNWKKLVYNPVQNLKLPKARKASVYVFNDEEIKRLLECAQQMKLSLLFRIALLLGMRIGELLGLKWSDIDFENMTVVIQRTVSYIKDPVTGVCGFHVGLPKTETSERLVYLPHDILVSLLALHEEQFKVKNAASQWKNLDLVFCTRNGNYIAPAYIRKLFDNLLDQAGLKHMKFHGLRHNASLVLRKLGIDSVVRKEMLGHSSLSMTDDTYGHSTSKMHKDAASEIDRLFGDERE